MNSRDLHCHFHGALPHDWLSVQLYAAGFDRIGAQLLSSRDAVTQYNNLGMCGRDLLFAHYAVREKAAHVLQSSGDLISAFYSEGAKQIVDAASANEILHTRLFFSFVPDAEVMNRRISGLLAAQSEVGGALSFRLTFPRRRMDPRPLDFLASALRPICDTGALVGLDISGLDIESPASTTLSWGHRLVALRDQLVVDSNDALTLSAHWAETLCADGYGATLSLGSQLLDLGFTSFGHCIALEKPGQDDSNLVVAASRSLFQALRRKEARVEYCPGVAALYGHDQNERFEFLKSVFGGRVDLGSDSPGLLGYSELKLNWG